MNDDSFIISGFACDVHGEIPLTVDFSKAKQLDRSGSTCDSYECTIQRRRVFVKRLKPEYRGNPLYRAAFDKEYDLGVTLSHPSLPRYVGYGSDYIVMDFIEGDTLADLMKRGDRRLKDKKFVNKQLSELIDVVEYLHNRNIVHCDIKSDNIIISPYKDRPVTLIDLDKAYTAWLDNTPGDPTRYDCDGCGDGEIDFRGLGMIAEILGQKHIAAVCRIKEVTADTIRKTLIRHTSRDRFRRWRIFAAIGLSCVIAFWAINKSGGLSEQQVSLQTTSGNAAAKEKTQELQTIDKGIEGRSDGSNANNKTVNEPKHESTADNSKAVKDAMTYEMSELDEIVMRYYGPLYNRHKYLRHLAANPKVSAEDLLQALKSYANDQYKAQGQIFNAVKKLYGLSDPFESMSIVGRNKEWSRFMHEDAEINELYGREMKKREMADSPNSLQHKKM